MTAPSEYPDMEELERVEAERDALQARVEELEADKAKALALLDGHGSIRSDRLNEARAVLRSDHREQT